MLFTVDCETHHICTPTPTPNHICFTRDFSIFSLASELPLTQTCFQIKNILFCIFLLSGFGVLEVACWPLVPKFAGSNPVEKILSTPSFGREVKPFVPCRIFTACKRTRKCMRGSRSFRSKLPAISRPSSSSFRY